MSVNEEDHRSTQILAAGRLTQPPSNSLIETAFSFEAKDGPLLYHGMSLADLSYTLHLAEQGLIPRQQAAGLLEALLELHKIPGEEFQFDPSHGDVFTNREYALKKMAPEASEWLGYGRARRESTTVGYTLVCCERLLSFARALVHFGREIMRLASDHLTTLMPDYTYLQRAQPTTFAHYILTFLSPIERDLARVVAIFDRYHRMPAGLGSVNGTRLPVDRRRLQELLGFQDLAIHTRDAMWMSDLAVEAAAVIQISLVNLDRLAEDLQIWASYEYRLIELADGHSRISVIMPNKKNPYALSYIRGICRQSLGRVVSIAATNMTPSGQVDNRIIAYGQVPEILDDGKQVFRLLADVLSTLTIHKDRMAAALETSLGATDLTELLVAEEAISPKMAHRVVGMAVLEAQKQGIPFSYDLVKQAMQALGDRPLNMTEQSFWQAVDPAEIVASRTGIGGAAPSAVQEMLASAEQWLSQGEAWIDEKQKLRQEADEKLLRTASRFVDKVINGGM